MSLAAGLARGLESGFNMGLRLDEVRANKRREEQAAERAAKLDRRAEEEFGLRRAAEERQVKREDRITRHQGAAAAIAALSGERDDLVKQATAVQAAGGAVDRGSAERYATVRQQLAKARETMTRLAAQDMTLDDVPDKDFYTSATLTLGTRPENLPAMARGAKEVEMGFDQQDQAMMLKGANSLLLPYLERGVGDESPYGGKIVRKQVVAFVPARGGDGQDRPDMVYPVLRVFVQTPNGEKYYDAPMTKGGSTVAEDNPVALDLNRAFDWMGNVSVLGQAFQDPRVAEKLARGRDEAGDVGAALNELRALGRPQPKATSREDEKAATARGMYERGEAGSVAEALQLLAGKVPGGSAPRAGGGGGGGGKPSALREKLAEIDKMNLPEAEKDDLRKAVIAGVKPRVSGAQENQERVRDAVDAVAADLGVRYDSNARDWRTAEGNPLTPAQRSALQRASERASTLARDAAARGRNVSQTELVQAARGAGAAPAPTAPNGLPSAEAIEAELKRRGVK